MSEKKIVSVGCEVPGGYSKYVSIDSDVSLFDYDIVLFRPKINSFAYSHENYRGKPSLDDSSSFRLKNRLSHWRREISEALHSGKTVFVFLTELYEVYVDTGQRQYSGTGRNRQTTRVVTTYDNYKSLPFELAPINAKGSEMKLISGSEIISSYWAEFKDYSTYEVLFGSDIKVAKPLIVTRTGERVLGALVRHEDSSGTMLLLPSLNFDAEEFTKENKKGELLWTKAAEQFGGRLTKSLVEIDKSLRISRSVSPAPTWVNSSEYDLPNEIRIRDDLLDISKKLDDLQLQKQKREGDLVKEGDLKKLLFEKGHLLEDAIVHALKIIGFSAHRYKDSESEFDVVFESSDGRFLGEAEGKDNNAISIDKLRQLEMNIHEDLAREEVLEPAKGVLFGNAYRLLPLSERGDFFTEKCTTAAKRSGTALIATPDLFVVAQYLQGNSDDKFSRDCRRAILETGGEIVKFPKPPIKFGEEKVVKELDSND